MRDPEQEGTSGPSLEIGALCPQPGQQCSLAASRDLYVATISLGIASRHFLGEGVGLGGKGTRPEPLTPSPAQGPLSLQGPLAPGATTFHPRGRPL